MEYVKQKVKPRAMGRVFVILKILNKKYLVQSDRLL